MNINMDYKHHVAAVKLTPSNRMSSVTPQKSINTRELYYENRAENDYNEEITTSYCNFDDERSAS